MAQKGKLPQFWSVPSTARRDFSSGAPSSSDFAGNGNGIGNSSSGKSSPQQPQHIRATQGYPTYSFLQPRQRQSASGAGIGVGAGGMNPPATSQNNYGPQSAERHEPDENTMDMPFYPPPPTTTNAAFSPPIRNSLSSHASERGRLLGQARAKNHELQQKISELEHTILSLQQHQLQQNGGNEAINNHYPSPTKYFSSPPVASLPNSPEKRPNNMFSSDYVEKLEAALQIETQRREAVEKKTARLLQQQQQQQQAKKSDLESDPLVDKLLDQASKLLEDSINSDATNIQEKEHAGTIVTQEQMHDYHELVTAFHSEQQSHGDIDGEEFISREDILWLLHELKWRFEELYLGYVESRSRTKEAIEISRIEEWKECLSGLVDVVKKARQDSRSTSSGTNENEPGDDAHQSESAHDLQDEVSALNQRLASFAAHHKETCRSLNDDMEAMKRHYQEQLSTKSQCIENLESKISEQEDYIAQIQKEQKQDQQWIKEEKQKLILNKEGTASRIRYLEGMLRSVQMELKESKTPQSGRIGGGVDKCNKLRENDAVTPEPGHGALSPPVFMRDLTVAMQTADLTQQDKCAETKKAAVRPKKEERRQSDKTPPPPPPAINKAETAKLLEKITTLSNSLADSETRRANLLEDFQQERKKYILQYKQMSELLKLLIEEEKINHT